MGRPPSSGGTSFRFTPAEVAEMDACLQQVKNAIPSRQVMSALAEKFSASIERAGKVAVQPKQVWNWFQNRRYAQRARTTRANEKINFSSASFEDPGSYRNAPHSISVAPEMGRSSYDNNLMDFEAKSARDGAWYDVATFLSHRMFESEDPEVRIRFAGFGVEEDEWVDVRKCVRQRSLPCEPPECVVVLSGDLILCFQEGKDQALYFDARVLDAQRRRHDIRGCRCRFLVRYEHDQSEEIVPLRKICRRPETDYRLRILQASKAFGQMDLKTMIKDSSLAGTSTEVKTTAQKYKNAVKLDINTDEVMTQSKVVTAEVGDPVAATISEVPGGPTEGTS